MAIARTKGRSGTRPDAWDRSVEGLDAIDRRTVRRRQHLVDRLREVLRPDEAVEALVPGGRAPRPRGIVALTQRRLIVVPANGPPTCLDRDDVGLLLPRFDRGQGELLVASRSDGWLQLTLGRPAVLDVVPTRSFREACRRLDSWFARRDAGPRSP